ncbi:MAG TPA: hypothetical protein VGX68_29485 [Thermoanaerobaculia bacterium]|jgi:hypothetical protein|nr:hypothetical protein [Thermoanaerobaculia bacterium]
MPRIPIADALTELESLSQSFTPEVTEQAPYLAQKHVELQRHMEEIRKLIIRRAAYEARKQEATRKIRDRIGKARRLATYLRSGLRLSYGSDSEELVKFGMKPFRGRKRSKKTTKQG